MKFKYELVSGDIVFPNDRREMVQRGDYFSVVSSRKSAAVSISRQVAKKFKGAKLVNANIKIIDVTDFAPDDVFSKIEEVTIGKVKRIINAQRIAFKADGQDHQLIKGYVGTAAFKWVYPDWEKPKLSIETSDEALDLAARMILKWTSIEDNTEEMKIVVEREEPKMKKAGGPTRNVTVAIGGKTYTKTVTVIVHKEDKDYCFGKVGNYQFYWRPKKFELPMLKLTKEQLTDLYKSVKVSERDKLYEGTRRKVKLFLLAWKTAVETTAADQPEKKEAAAKRVHETAKENIPEGFEPLGDEVIFE